MSNPNLVQKPITDKNGVVSTRWVKPASDGTERGRMIAAPSIKPQETSDPKALMDYALETITPEWESFTDKGYRSMWFLAQHSPDRFRRLLDQCSEPGPLQQLWVHRLQNSFLSPMKDTEREREQYLQTWQRQLDIYPMGMELIKLVNDDMGNPKLLRDHTIALEAKVYDLLAWGTSTLNRDANEEPDPELAKAVALIGIVRGVYDERAWRMDNAYLQYADIEEDAEYIKNHVDEVASLVPELIARKSHDRSLIQSLLETDSKALREGAL